MLVASCLFHREGQREIQHTPASSRARRPNLSVTAAAQDNRLPSQCRERQAAARPTYTRRPWQTPGEACPRGWRAQGAGWGSRGHGGAGLRGAGLLDVRSKGRPAPALFLLANSPTRSCTIFQLRSDLQSPEPQWFAKSLKGTQSSVERPPPRSPRPPGCAELSPAT